MVVYYRQRENGPLFFASCHTPHRAYPVLAGVFKLLSAILMLGNVELHGREESSVREESQEAFNCVVDLLKVRIHVRVCKDHYLPPVISQPLTRFLSVRQIPRESLLACLTTKQRQLGGNTFTTNLR